jgi:hypothetical protein
MAHWHRLGERCGYCSQVTAPTRFYLDGSNQPTLSQEQAEAGYLSWLEPNIPALFGVLQKCVAGVNVLQESAKVCCSCSKSFGGRGKECPTCRSKRARAK